MELKRGWPVLLAVTIGMSFGATGLLPNLAGIFVKAVNAEFGWSLTRLATLQLVAALGTTISAPLWGFAVDRFGVLRVAATGFIGLVLALIGLSLVPAYFPLFAAIWMAMMWLGTATSAIPFVRPLKDAFDKRRGLALGVMLAGVGIIGACTPVPIAIVVKHYGWRTAYVCLAALAAAGGGIGLSLLALARRTRQRQTAVVAKARNEIDTAGAAGALLGDPVLWRLIAALMVMSFALNGYVFHLVPMLTGFGLPLERAAAAQSFLAIGMIVVRLLAGAAMDRIFAPWLAALLLLISAAGLVALSAHRGGDVMLFLAAGAIGLSYGAEVDLIAYLTTRYFDARHFGRAYGLLYGVGILGTGTSPLILSLLSHGGTNYRPALIASLVAIAVPIALFATLPKYRRTPTQAEALVAAT